MSTYVVIRTGSLNRHGVRHKYTLGRAVHTMQVWKHWSFNQTERQLALSLLGVKAHCWIFDVMDACGFALIRTFRLLHLLNQNLIGKRLGGFKCHWQKITKSAGSPSIFYLTHFQSAERDAGNAKWIARGREMQPVSNMRHSRGDQYRLLICNWWKASALFSWYNLRSWFICVGNVLPNMRYRFTVPSARVSHPCFFFSLAYLLPFFGLLVYLGPSFSLILFSFLPFAFAFSIML